jgi:hypothetical protein
MNSKRGVFVTQIVPPATLPGVFVCGAYNANCAFGLIALLGRIVAVLPSNSLTMVIFFATITDIYRQIPTLLKAPD